MLQDLSQVYLSEGLKNLQLRKINSSIAHFKKALLFDSNNWQAMNLMGLCLYLQGFFQEAGNIWSKSLLVNTFEGNPAQEYLGSLEKEDFKALCGMYNNALKLAQTGDYKQAYGILNHDLFNKCSIVSVLNVKGLCLLALGKQRDAVRLWKESLALNVEDIEAVNYIAESAETKGEGKLLYSLLRRIFTGK